MSKKKENQKEEKNESSTVGGGAVKGFMGPFATTKRKRNNPNKPYGEEKIFENSVIYSLLEGENIKTKSIFNHPSSLYHSPKFVNWLKSNSNVQRDLKNRYKDKFLGMIDSIDATFSYQPQKWNNDPQTFLDWYVGSKFEKEDLDWFDSQEANEVVRKRGNRWVIFDDETDVEMGSYPKRKDAWERQRQIRRSDQARKKQKDAERERQRRAGRPEVEKKPGIKRPKGTIAKKAKKEYIDRIKRVLKENFIRYIFEQPETDQKSQMWNKFVESLSNETLMSDQKLKNILIKSVKAESSILEKAFGALEKVLKGTGNFDVIEKKKGKDPKDNETKVFFKIKMNEAEKAMPFAIKIENGRPLIHIPDQTRQELNMLASPDSKTLTGELIHIQETIFNTMEDVINIFAKRDNYLKKLEDEIDKLITNMNPLQIAMVKFLIKNKYRDIK